jgi:tRNA pseudouridine38-40 synthase
MIGYSGTGYKGMQVNPGERTIEGDLFDAFVAAGAISKSNSDDPKKSSLVRCARTDKGVHAAGNVISLKLIVEDDDIIQKINEHLPEQIRVWGIERTNKGFSCYKMCDSRVYEYLIPSHVFLPPHPTSHLGKLLKETAEKEGMLDDYEKRRTEVADFWPKIDTEQLEPVLAALSPEDRTEVLGEVFHERFLTKHGVQSDTIRSRHLIPVIKQAKAIISNARKSFRMPPERLARIRETFNTYCGTHRFHNFTIDKKSIDPSCKRLIRSFNVSEPFVPSEKKDGLDPGSRPSDPEYLSLKVHGQSFMMHQIRKMVSLAVLSVRSGCDPTVLIPTALSQDLRVSIPKAPGLGLLLERPVFDSFNKLATDKFKRQAIDFSNYEAEMESFKQREIYDRIWLEDEKGDIFSNFFSSVDGIPNAHDEFWYLTSGLQKKADEKRATQAQGADKGPKGKVGSRAQDAELSAMLEGKSIKEVDEEKGVEEG